MAFRIEVPKYFAIFTSALDSLFNKVAGLNTFNFIKKRLQKGVFL